LGWGGSLDQGRRYRGCGDPRQGDGSDHLISVVPPS
jgi:hypothetical protein